MKRRLLADSGSTKTDWLLYEGEQCVLRMKTQGINPFMLSGEEIEKILRDELLPQLSAKTIDEVEFYGAGCRGEQCKVVAGVLSNVLNTSVVQVDSDMLGAARALCGSMPGVVCILGTGSNSCLYDGQRIVQNVSPLGFILGDEGSGAVLGKRLLGDLLKEQLPLSLYNQFLSDYSLSLDDIICKVYRESFPNRFLASFAPFLFKHRRETAVHDLLLDEFSRFFQRNVANYHHSELPVHFVGSIAHYFRDEVREAADACGFQIGKIKKAPLDEE